MTTTPCVQGRAPSLYDEQLQRAAQEKSLDKAEPRWLGRCWGDRERDKPAAGESR